MASTLDVTLVFKGRSEALSLAIGGESTTDALFDAARRLFELENQNLKILVKGKQLVASAPLLQTPLAAAVAGTKCMVMATGARSVQEVVSARSDPTVRSFASEDAAAAHHRASQQQQHEETSAWGEPQRQDARYRFCRLESCTWQSFGTRPSSRTPHAFEARALLLKLACDPPIVAIMRERQWTVGLLAELDPVDDRLAEKMEGEGKRLLGFNTNAGAEIHVRLRTHDLSGFLSYPALIDTLLHELAHNVVGPHNEHFWHLFCQLKADYLSTLARLTERGDRFGGKAPLLLAEAADEAKDVRLAVLAALARDRQMPVSPVQVQLLDGYLAASAGRTLAGPIAGGSVLGGAADAPAAPTSAVERRELLAARASARFGGAAPSAPMAPPEALALKVVDGGAEPTAVAATAAADGQAQPEAAPMDVSDASDGASRGQ